MSSLRKTLVVGLIVLVVVSWGGLSQGWFVPEPTQITGKVFDAATKRPIEGAFVLASYTKCGRGILLGHFGGNCPCFQTKGLLSASDGGFNISLLDGVSPTTISTLAKNYYVKEVIFPEWSENSSPREKARRFSDWEIWLAPQEPGNPSFRYEIAGSACTDIGDGREFNVLESEERKRLNPSLPTRDSFEGGATEESR